MNDELIMRMWNADHDRFSHDLDRVLGGIGTALFRRTARSEGIGRTYADGAPQQPPRTAGNPLLGGLAAVVTTTALLVVLAAFAGPGPALGHPTIELADATQGGPASVAV